MKKYVKILPLAALFFAFSVNADVELKDNSEILGKWKVYAEAQKLDGEQKSLTIKKQTKLGQEKYESCSVVEKDGSKMILKCQFMYYFLAKI